MRSPRFQALGDTVDIASLQNQTWLAVGDDNIWNFDMFKEAAVKVQPNASGPDGKDKPKVIERVRYPRLNTMHAFAKDWPGEF